MQDRSDETVEWDQDYLLSFLIVWVGVVGWNGGRVVVCCVSTRGFGGEMKLGGVPDTLLGKWGKHSIASTFIT